jgi:predicted peptidase
MARVDSPGMLQVYASPGKRVASMSRYLFVGAVLLILELPAFAKHETGFLDRTVTVQGVTYRYQVFVPALWDAHKEWPVILALHGAGERGSDGLLQTAVGFAHAIRTQADNDAFIAVLPQCPKDKFWTDSAEEEQALAALDASIKEFKGDRDRIYLTGLSMGGYGAWDMAAKYPHRFAAYMVICGGLHDPKGYQGLHVGLVDDPKIADPYAETARRVGNTPVWIFHGEADDTVPVEESRKMQHALQAMHANVKYTEYPGVGHQAWDKAYAEPDAISWLLMQHLQH